MSKSKNQHDTKKELAKELGLTEALTIGVGTMIGAGIFVLPRYAIEMLGPGAIFPYILAAIVCIITANSMAELSTGMPKSGGTYFFVSRSLGSFVGTISGLSLWLSLSFAVAFYLRGFGEYLAFFTQEIPFLPPINDIILALLAGLFFVYVNYVGAKETGKTQNIIVGILIPILLGFIVLGFLNVEFENWTPFMTSSYRTIFPTTAIIFVSFLGFEQIASVAEEIKKPSYTIPRAIMGSVIIATLLYVPVILVTTGIIPSELISQYEAPILEAARAFSGIFGFLAVSFAALLATASSANASIMASSRINFAMGRDNILPRWLNKVHRKFLTPYRPIVATGILTLILVVVADVEQLSSSASVLMLINYSILNLTVIILRLAPPKDYKPSYKSFGYPFLHIIGAIASLFIIIGADSFAKISAVVLMVIGVLWFFVWSNKKANLKAAISDIKLNDILQKNKRDEEVEIPRDAVLNNNLRILTPMADPKHETALLKISSNIIKHTKMQGEITALNIIEIPSQTPLDFLEDNDENISKVREAQRTIIDNAIKFGEKENQIINPRVLYSRNRFNTVMNIIKKEKFDFLVLGWHGSFSIGHIYNSFVNQLVRNAPCSVGVLKDQGLEDIENILVPYRGSEHAYFGIELALKMVSPNKGKVSVLRIIKEGNDKEKEKEKALNELKPLLDQNNDLPGFEIIVIEAENVVNGILKTHKQNNYDLIIMGASKEWTLKNLLFGSIPDIVAEESKCSVLMLRKSEAEIVVDQEFEELNSEEKLDKI
ncbi:amino acid permease [Natronospora cellulosivora (SeqCode)]